jgi:hypothetical protein
VQELGKKPNVPFNNQNLLLLDIGLEFQTEKLPEKSDPPWDINKIRMLFWGAILAP